ncbi:hypothetical protein ACH5RR_039554 [Cinchona calisaya]|uniref:DUF4806 domain-containing protein n=1 Tax=Cinchona calisaya TaxID=153742 RepID=A0ABD2Y0A7_9GENT
MGRKVDEGLKVIQSKFQQMESQIEEINKKLDTLSSRLDGEFNTMTKIISKNKGYIVEEVQPVDDYFSMPTCPSLMLKEEEIVVVNKEKLDKPKYGMISKDEFCEFLDDRFNGKEVLKMVHKISVLMLIQGFNGINLKERRNMISWMDYQNSKKVTKVQVGYSHIQPLIPMFSAHDDFSEDDILGF